MITTALRLVLCSHVYLVFAHIDSNETVDFMQKAITENFSSRFLTFGAVIESRWCKNAIYDTIKIEQRNGTRNMTTIGQ